MAVLEILRFPDPRLREVARPVESIDRNLQGFIDDMFETMYDASGVGLAATQVGVARRVAVMDCSGEENGPIVMINPEIVVREEPVTVEEGCLSVPEHYDSVTRHKRVMLRAQDRDGEPYELEAEGLLAQCIQHEIDHLDGGLYIDQLSRLKRERIRRRLEKAQKREG
jgi:peptide deformylase